MHIQRAQPIAYQVETLLRKRILSKEFTATGRLPSEAELASALGVSRATVRTALAALAAEGLVIRKQGDGTYVNQRGLEIKTRIETIWDFPRLIEESGRTPTIQLAAAERRAAARQEATALELAPGADVLALKRLFLADEKPVIFSINILPAALLCTDMNPAQMELPISQFLTTNCGQEFVYAVADLSAALVDTEVGGALDLESGGPILKFIEVFYNAQDQPLVYAINYYDDKVLRLRIIRS